MGLFSFLFGSSEPSYRDAYHQYLNESNYSAYRTDTDKYNANSILNNLRGYLQRCFNEYVNIRSIDDYYKIPFLQVASDISNTEYDESRSSSMCQVFSNSIYRAEVTAVKFPGYEGSGFLIKVYSYDYLKITMLISSSADSRMFFHLHNNYTISTLHGLTK